MRAGIVLAAVMAVGLAGCSKSSSPTEPGGGNNNTNNSAATTISITAGVVDPSYDAGKNSSTGAGFSPPSVTVTAGGQVVWQNNDTLVHYPITDTGSFGGTVDAGGTYKFTFTAKGTYTYHCLIHPDMTGTIVVQ